MLITAAPSLPFVIGLPAGLMAVVGLFSFAAYTVIGRIGRG